ncbi:MAG: phosphoribosyltransferase [Sphingobacteriales bacterium]|nr:MAG: phosphoribosyltransferase [Sphingobacteriales bacterium]
MAYEIAENNIEANEIVLAGITESGSIIARNIAAYLQAMAAFKITFATIGLDKKHPVQVTVDVNDNFDNKVIIVMDDVANSGKTLLYGLKPFMAFHPKKIQTLVLVERSHKTFPIHPDYVGLSIATTLQEHIYVETEGDTVNGAWME